MDIQKDEDFEKAWQENRHIWESTKNLAKAMFYAGQAKAKAIPDGFVVVPEEPTERMLDSAYSSISDNLHYADLENIYKAMIWSAQEQSHD